MPRLFLFLVPCIVLAQYPKAMDFSKLYQGKLDSIVVIHRTGWTKETSWSGAPEEEHITEERKLLPLSKGKQLLKILQDKIVYKEEYPLLNDVVSSFLFYANGNEVLTIHFSTETKQLTMYRGDELIFAGMSKGKLTKKLIYYLYPNLSAKELYMNFFILWEEI
ncbi:hypothetical protein HMPREF1321_1657 [Capnocytophaga sp. oral taxon 412 str. F0487]|uniref:hypothetical protein n=1 Tax=Capnocytophaga sp. oral taxon 412 TaxID=712218 RepID=UPI0002696B1D|nr:hypothetical protein [Capnocytophaga sp. oral taxon 412]EIW91707.1 hypothetical protein HMPREF1321_1657 [Capnocytophaga sp. oral taxon 412 str. F0487]